MKTEIEYIKVDDYYLPNLKVTPTEEMNLSQFGRMKLKYIKEYQGGLYFKLLATNELNNYLKQIDKEANEMYDRLIKEYKIKWNVTEELKMEN